MRKPVPMKPNKVHTPKTVYNRKKYKKEGDTEMETKRVYCPSCQRLVLANFNGPTGQCVVCKGIVLNPKPQKECKGGVCSIDEE